MTRYDLGSEVAVSEDSDGGSSEPESVVPGGGITWPVWKKYSCFMSPCTNVAHTHLSKHNAVQPWVLPQLSSTTVDVLAWTFGWILRLISVTKQSVCTYRAQWQKTWLHLCVHGNRAVRGPWSSMAPSCSARRSLNCHRCKLGQRCRDDLAMLLISC